MNEKTEPFKRRKRHFIIRTVTISFHTAGMLHYKTMLPKTRGLKTLEGRIKHLSYSCWDEGKEKRDRGKLESENSKEKKLLASAG